MKIGKVKGDVSDVQFKARAEEAVVACKAVGE